MNGEALLRRENDAAYRLMFDIAATINQRGVTPAVALLALAKLVGQTAVMIDPHKPADLVEAAAKVAQDEMRLRATAQALQAAGLGALMPVRRA